MRRSPRPGLGRTRKDDSIAGSVAAHYAGFISPAKVSFFHSIELVTMVVFGGLASTFGAAMEPPADWSSFSKNATPRAPRVTISSG